MKLRAVVKFNDKIIESYVKSLNDEHNSYVRLVNTILEYCDITKGTEVEIDLYSVETGQLLFSCERVKK